MKLAIITPTYNRAKLLVRLHESLCRQTSKDFTWIVVDDGSKDDTSSLVAQWAGGSDGFVTRYLKVSNGGKSRALNRGFEQNQDIDFFAIVDSDDSLLDDGVEKIANKAREYLYDEFVGSIMFNYNDTCGKVIGSDLERFCIEENIATIYDHTKVYDLHDGCIGYYGRAVTEYRFPEFEGEKYVGPTVLQMLIADKYKTVFSPIVVGIAEYQEGGLTKSGRALRLRNPLGMMKYCELKQTHRNRNWIETLKYAVGTQAYLKASGLSVQQAEASGIGRSSFKFWAYLPGSFLYLRWSKQC